MIGSYGGPTLGLAGRGVLIFSDSSQSGRGSLVRLSITAVLCVRRVVLPSWIDLGKPEKPLSAPLPSDLSLCQKQ